MRASRLLAASLTALVLMAHAADAGRPAGGRTPIPLKTPELRDITLERAMAGPHRIVLVTKTWSPANPDLFAILSKFRLRLNRGGLSTAVVFLGADPWAVRRATPEGQLKVRWFLDPEGATVRAFSLATVPTIVLLAPSGKVVFSTPFLNEGLVRQLAGHHAEDNPVPAAVGTLPAHPGTPPLNAEGRYELR